MRPRTCGSQSSFTHEEDLEKKKIAVNIRKLRTFFFFFRKTILMAEEEAVPLERPTQRLVSRAADPHPLNRLPVGLQSEDELDDDLLLAQAVENYVGTHMHDTLKELLAAPDPHAHYPVHLT